MLELLLFLVRLVLRLELIQVVAAGVVRERGSGGLLDPLPLELQARNLLLGVLAAVLEPLVRAVFVGIRLLAVHGHLTHLMCVVQVRNRIEIV